MYFVTALQFLFEQLCGWPRPHEGGDSQLSLLTRSGSGIRPEPTPLQRMAAVLTADGGATLHSSSAPPRLAVHWLSAYRGRPC